MMMNGLLLDDSMSIITSASNEDASISSGNRNEGLYPQQQKSSATPNPPPPPKRKRNLPGNPDPEAEVVALSPQTLMATNRFICEICNKGFKRDQNLQLHRRGHNLPWKLKQRENKDQVKKKVYVCPEPTCAHHDPSRALGDLTGIKKHFFRKHGEKKWKCEKCSKRYAVQTDWKAHFKICGTREYKCDCGTIFSRRDSFITHRAFCDALAEENAMSNMANTTQPNPIISSNYQFALHPFPLKTELQDPLPGNSHFALHPFPLKTELQDPLPGNSHFSLHPWLSTQTGLNTNPTDQFFSQNPNAHMSATSLLQRAAQMGVTFSKPQQTHEGQTVTTGTGLFFSTGPATDTSLQNGNMVMHTREGLLAPFLGKTSIASGGMENIGATDFEMGGNLPSFEEAFRGVLNQKMGRGAFENEFRNSLSRGRNQDLTRDFLGQRPVPQGGFANMAGLDHHINSMPSYDQHSQN